MATAGDTAASADDEQRTDPKTVETTSVVVSTSGEQAGGSHKATDEEEATIVEAWRSGKYPTKERCLIALGMERFNNAALWKRVKRAIDRTSRRPAAPN